jgi:ERCC4-type nuclease
MKQIENIFSKTKTKSEHICPNPKTPIIIDSRESQSLITANLMEQKANIQHELLEIGDYLINDIIVERKTYSDFLSSITDKRLFTQIKQMKKYESQYLILEGFDFSYKSRLHQNAIRGTLLSIANLIPIIYTENERDTTKFIIQIAKRQEKLPQNFSLRQTKSNLTSEQQKQFILEGFPGIGPTTAGSLLEKFGSLKKIFNTTETQLEKILDKNKLKKILSLLN